MAHRPSPKKVIKLSLAQQGCAAFLVRQQPAGCGSGSGQGQSAGGGVNASGRHDPRSSEPPPFVERRRPGRERRADRRGSSRPDAQARPCRCRRHAPTGWAVRWARAGSAVCGRTRALEEIPGQPCTAAQLPDPQDGLGPCSDRWLGWFGWAGSPAVRQLQSNPRRRPPSSPLSALWLSFPHPTSSFLATSCFRLLLYLKQYQLGISPAHPNGALAGTSCDLVI
ncbi:hypothetical protein PVAP13_9KG307897 [Panicum virgatum]|uniref:Uncharacterized protein n=1 Tax=Panicum virgatum TaxID=38727 RepID=A0A8T0NF89_PANVG|nr:hypothetical protein PVAP13_9KG307897 [Panicum virgatum]